MAFRRRLAILLLVAAASMAVLWLRVVHLQWVDGDDWARQAEALRERTERTAAPRGRIVDADGTVLAEDSPVLKLALVGWEWERRARARCPRCGSTHFHAAASRPPRRCSCGAEGASLVRLPAEDLAPLEDLLALPHGTLERRIASRLEKISALVAAYGRRLLEEGEDPFWVDDKQRLRREDLMRRPFLVHADALPDEAVRLIALDEAGRYRGLRLETARVRRYPQGDLMPQAIGYAQPVFEKEYQDLRREFGDDVTLETRIGRAGIELAFQGQLLGRSGMRRMARDADGAFTVLVEEVEPRPGHEVRLAARVDACRKAEEVLERWATPGGFAVGGRPSAAFLAMDADTGEIVAWGEAPRFHLEEDLDRIFDPAWSSARYDRDAHQWVPTKELPKGETLDSWRAWLTRPDSLILSRVAEIPLEPGSTMKPVVGLAMLESGRGLPWEHFTCTGGPGNPRCHHGGHGTLDFVEALGRSCNRWFAWSLRDSALWPVYRTSVAEYVDRIGFGHAVFRDVEVDRHSGATGRGLWLRPPRGGWGPEARPAIAPDDGRLVAIGQGPVTVTPVHLARAYAVFANGGRLVTPHLVRSVGGDAQTWPSEDLGVSDATLRKVRRGLRWAVDDVGGTAANVDWSKVERAATVYGKTGTAQVGGGYRGPEALEDGGPWHHWFAGFAEANADGVPPLVFVCVLYARTEAAAGMTAAPAVAEFLEWWFSRTRE